MELSAFNNTVKGTMSQISIPTRSLDIELVFPRAIRFATTPAFVVRSAVGHGLRRLVCFYRDRDCRSCELRRTCAYGFLFESPHEGRDGETVRKGVHPYTLRVRGAPGDTLVRLAVSIRFFGRAVDYVPYVYAALARRAQFGLWRDSGGYEFGTVAVDGHATDPGSETLAIPSEVARIPLIGASAAGPTTEIRAIEFLTPLRLKADGRYTTDFELSQLLGAVGRRVLDIADRFARVDTQSLDLLRTLLRDQTLVTGSARIGERRLNWCDRRYKSHRQGREMRMGGAEGSITLDGSLGPLGTDLVRLGEHLGVGKATSFGLGWMEAVRVPVAARRSTRGDVRPTNTGGEDEGA